MTTTVKHVGSKREWEGSIESWEKHGEMIKWWCTGGEVEWRYARERWGVATKAPLFHPENEYRIKQREPKPGEVWEYHGTPVFARYHGTHSDSYRLIALDGSTNFNTAEGLIYLAPSLEAYYAREFLKQGGGSTADVHRVIVEAAQLD